MKPEDAVYNSVLLWPSSFQLNYMVLSAFQNVVPCDDVMIPKPSRANRGAFVQTTVRNLRELARSHVAYQTTYHSRDTFRW